MSDKIILKTIREHVNRQNNNWKFIMGRDVFDKKAFLEKLDNDRKFRGLIIKMAVNLTVNIWNRKGAEK